MRESRRIFVLCGTLFFLVFSFFPAVQAAPNAQTIRVGFYDDGDYMKRNENGEYVGFNFEFLQEVAKYSGWQYEIIDGKSWENTLNLLKTGEIDLLPAVYRTDERAEQILFSSYPMSNIYATLNVREDDTRYDYEDFSAFNGMKVGVIRGSKDADNFITYCRAHAIDLTIVPYTETSDLLKAFKNGTLDGVAITHLGRSSTFRSVAQFAPESLYLALAKDRTDLLAQLNSALTTMKLRNPNYDARLYDKYFAVSASQRPVFTKEEQAFIRQAGEITAVYDPIRAPLGYTDPKTGEFSGVIADLFKEMAKNSGLRFKFIAAESYTDALRISQSPSIDVICGMNSDYLWNRKYNLNASQYYLRIPVVMVSNGLSQDITRIALQSGSPLSQKIAEDNPDKQVQYYESAKACFEALVHGAADVTYTNTHIADYLLSDSRYKRFTVTTLVDGAEELSIGVSRAADPRLFSILDKCMQYISTEQLNGIILKNSLRSRTVTWQDMIRQHPIETFGGVIAIFSVITGLLGYFLAMKSRSKKRIEQLLYKDELTDLWNLNKFRIEALLLLRRDSSGAHAVLYVDIKQFRPINDTFGFKEGDRVLCAFADVLRDEVVAGECCARVSADHFVLLLRYDGQESLDARIAAIDDRLNDWVSSQGRHYRLILVFGAYIVKEAEAQDISLMLDFASCAKRNAPVTHKTLLVMYDQAMRQEELFQRTLADRMKAALQGGEFIPYFQPKVDMPSGELIGSEALVRWQHPEKAMIAPGAFIPFFEKNGFVVEIDLNIFEQVCRAMQGWIAEGRKVCPVSCNFSRLHFKDVSFPQKLVDIADRYRIPHNYLELEVTESVFMGNPDQVMRHFAQLKELGFSISIDDFGSGYSSLGLLQQFAVDVIKLDRSFIKKGLDTKRERAVVHAIIQLAKQLEMQVICEGVETAKQMRTLIDMGCFMGQGYYYARPMPQDEFEGILRDAKPMCRE